jgi:hypothetical protein
MDAIDFIEKDNTRGMRRGAITRAVVAAAAVLVPMGLGLGLRDSADGAFAPRVFLPNCLAGLGLAIAIGGMFRGRFASEQVFRRAWSLLPLVLLLATERIFFPPGSRTIYADGAQFWQESARCFLKGGLTAGLFGAFLCLAAYRFSCWPSRRWRGLLSAAAGIAGAIMLGFHCDSSSWSHVLVSHIGAGAVLGLMLFAGQEVLFGALMRRAFPRLSRSDLKQVLR